MKTSKKRFAREVSAGGLVVRSVGSPRLLMIRVRNLEGRVVWTFPKGHLEAGETPRQAALREVLEETGWRCRILPERGGKKHFWKARYGFRRGPALVKKEVVWFRMSALRRTGRRDPEEIQQVRWAEFKEAARRIAYPSDQKILAKLKPFFSR